MFTLPLIPAFSPGEKETVYPASENRSLSDSIQRKAWFGIVPSRFTIWNLLT